MKDSPAFYQSKNHLENVEKRWNFSEVMSRSDELNIAHLELNQ